MYELAIVLLLITGLVASGFFVLTWAPLAIRAKLRGLMPYSALDLIDFAGLQTGIFVLYALSVWNLHQHGVQPPSDAGIMAARIISTVLFNLIAYLRAWRWLDELLTSAPGEPASLSPTRGASSDRHHALEGRADEHAAGQPES